MQSIPSQSFSERCCDLTEVIPPRTRPLPTGWEKRCTIGSETKEPPEGKGPEIPTPLLWSVNVIEISLINRGCCRGISWTEWPPRELQVGAAGRNAGAMWFNPKRNMIRGTQSWRE